MKLKKIIQWIMIGISTICIAVFIIISELNIQFSSWFVLAWWLFHNSIWVIELVWKQKSVHILTDTKANLGDF